MLDDVLLMYFQNYRYWLVFVVIGFANTKKILAIPIQIHICQTVLQCLLLIDIN